MIDNQAAPQSEGGILDINRRVVASMSPSSDGVLGQLRALGVDPASLTRRPDAPMTDAQRNDLLWQNAKSMTGEMFDAALEGRWSDVSPSQVGSALVQAGTTKLLGQTAGAAIGGIYDEIQAIVDLPMQSRNWFARLVTGKSLPELADAAFGGTAPLPVRMLASRGASADALLDDKFTARSRTVDPMASRSEMAAAIGEYDPMSAPGIAGALGSAATQVGTAIALSSIPGGQVAGAARASTAIGRILAPAKALLGNPGGRVYLGYAGGRQAINRSADYLRFNEMDRNATSQYNAAIDRLGLGDVLDKQEVPEYSRMTDLGVSLASGAMTAFSEMIGTGFSVAAGKRIIGRLYGGFTPKAAEGGMREMLKASAKGFFASGSMEGLEEVVDGYGQAIIGGWYDWTEEGGFAWAEKTGGSFDPLAIFKKHAPELFYDFAIAFAVSAPLGAGGGIASVNRRRNWHDAFTKALMRDQIAVDETGATRGESDFLAAQAIAQAMAGGDPSILPSVLEHLRKTMPEIGQVTESQLRDPAWVAQFVRNFPLVAVRLSEMDGLSRTQSEWLTGTAARGRVPGADARGQFLELVRAELRNMIPTYMQGWYERSTAELEAYNRQLQELGDKTDDRSRLLRAQAKSRIKFILDIRKQIQLAWINKETIDQSTFESWLRFDEAAESVDIDGTADARETSPSTARSDAPGTDEIRARARAGDAEAAFTLAQMHESGQGAEQHFYKSQYWMSVALANSGDVEAMVYLGRMYAGRAGAYPPMAGAPRSINKARAWLRKAYELGSDEAGQLLAELETGSPARPRPGRIDAAEAAQAARRQQTPPAASAAQPAPATPQEAPAAPAASPAVSEVPSVAPVAQQPESAPVEADPAADTRRAVEARVAVEQRMQAEERAEAERRAADEADAPRREIERQVQQGAEDPGLRVRFVEAATPVEEKIAKAAGKLGKRVQFIRIFRDEAREGDRRRRTPSGIRGFVGSDANTIYLVQVPNVMREQATTAYYLQTLAHENAHGVIRESDAETLKRVDALAGRALIAEFERRFDLGEGAERVEEIRVQTLTTGVVDAAGLDAILLADTAVEKTIARLKLLFNGLKIALTGNERAALLKRLTQEQVARAKAAKEAAQKTEAAPEAPVVAVQGFTTSKGSTYTIDAKGHTSRFKRSPGAGQGTQQGSLPAVYLSSADAQRLEAALSYDDSIVIGEVSADGKSVEQLRPDKDMDLRGRRLAVYAIEKGGKVREVLRASTSPAVGLHPLELGYEGETKRYHLGNKIVSLDSASPAPAAAEPAATRAAKPKPATQPTDDLARLIKDGQYVVGTTIQSGIPIEVVADGKTVVVDSTSQSKGIELRVMRKKLYLLSGSTASVVTSAKILDKPNVGKAKPKAAQPQAAQATAEPSPQVDPANEPVASELPKPRRGRGKKGDGQQAMFMREKRWGMPTMGSAFSGMGTWEIAMRGIADPVSAIEMSPNIAVAYALNNGEHVMVEDVTKVRSDIAKGVDLFCASPVCKAYSDANRNRGEQELDIASANWVASVVRDSRPANIAIENVPSYRTNEAYRIIEASLRKHGYKFDANVYDSSDFGAATSRKRLIVRATLGELPPAPLPTHGVGGVAKIGWMEAAGDLIESLPAAPPIKKGSLVDRWLEMEGGLGNEPLLIMGSPPGLGTKRKGIRTTRRGDEPSPTIKATPKEVIRVWTGSEMKRATPRFLARLHGISDDVSLPSDEKLAKTVIGNGIPLPLVRAVVGPMVSSGDRVAFMRERTDSQLAADHRAAFERGDESAAREIVREYGRRKGYTIEAYHGSPSGPFTMFDEGKRGDRTSSRSSRLGFFATSVRQVASEYMLTQAEMRDNNKGGPIGFGLEDAYADLERYRDIDTGAEFDPGLNGWIAYHEERDRYGEFGRTDIDVTSVFDSRQEAEDYAEEVKNRLVRKAEEAVARQESRWDSEVRALAQGRTLLHLLIRMQNPFVRRYDGGDFRDQSYTEVIQEAIDEEHDGVILKDTVDSIDTRTVSDIYVFFDPNQAKSADPFTYDSNGELIPLDKRFDESTDDIRFLREKPGSAFEMFRDDSPASTRTNRLATALFWKYTILDRAVKAARRTLKIEPEDAANELFQLAPGISSRIMLDFGNAEVRPYEKAVKELAKKLKIKEGKVMDLVQEHAFLKHALDVIAWLEERDAVEINRRADRAFRELDEMGIEVSPDEIYEQVKERMTALGLNKEQARARLRAIEGQFAADPAWANLSDRLRAMNRKTLEIHREAGNITEAAYQELVQRYPNYVPVVTSLFGDDVDVPTSDVKRPARRILRRMFGGMKVDQVSNVDALRKFWAASWDLTRYDRMKAAHAASLVPGDNAMFRLAQQGKLAMPDGDPLVEVVDMQALVREQAAIERMRLRRERDAAEAKAERDGVELPPFKIDEEAVMKEAAMKVANDIDMQIAGSANDAPSIRRFKLERDTDMTPQEVYEDIHHFMETGLTVKQALANEQAAANGDKPKHTPLKPGTAAFDKRKDQLESRIRLLPKGTVMHYRINDPDLAQAMLLNEPTMLEKMRSEGGAITRNFAKAWMKLMAFQRFAFVSASPGFWKGELFRSPQQAAIMGRVMSEELGLSAEQKDAFLRNLDAILVGGIPPGLRYPFIGIVGAARAMPGGKPWRSVKHVLKGNEPRNAYEQMVRKAIEDGVLQGGLYSVDSYETMVAKLKERIGRSMEGEPTLRQRASDRVDGVTAWASDVVDQITNGLDMVNRLNVYQAATMAGISRQQAAIMARESTVDFSKKGASMRGAGQVYLFLGPRMQGIHQLLRAFSTGEGKTMAARTLSSASKRILMRMFLWSFAFKMLREFFYEDDDEPQSVPSQFASLQNMLVPMMAWNDKKQHMYLEINNPYGFGAIAKLADRIGEFLVGDSTAVEMLVGAVGDFGSELTPLAFNLNKPSSVIQAITPTNLQVGTDLLLNQDWKGSPIYPEGAKFGPGEQRRSQQYFAANTWRTSIWLADVIADLTRPISQVFGFEGQRGIEISPNQIQYVFQRWMPGLVRMAADGVSVVSSGKDARGNDVTLARIPFLVGSGLGVVTETGGRSVVAGQWRDMGTIRANMKVDLKEGRESRRQILERYGDVGRWFERGAYDNAERQIKKLQQARNVAMRAGKRDVFDRINERIEEIQTRVLREYARIRERSSGGGIDAMFQRGVLN